MSIVYTDDSSWIRSVSYVPMMERPAAPSNVDGLLVVESRTGTAYVYAVPAWVMGLFAAAVARGRSVGRLFSRTVRGRYQSAKVSAEDLHALKAAHGHRPVVAPGGVA